MPNWPEIISAVTRQNHAVPMPIDRPVTMFGAAAGRITSEKMVQRPAPRLRADATRRGSAPSTPWIVFSRIGNSAPMNVMNTIDSSDDGNIRIASGIQATAGIGRSISSGGSSTSSSRRERPMTRPSPMPATPAAAKPANTRHTLAFRCSASLGDSTSVVAASSTSFGDGTFWNETRPRSRWCVAAHCQAATQATSDSARSSRRPARRSRAGSSVRGAVVSIEAP
jgi:hypothetical protein